MRLTLSILATGLAVTAAPAGAQSAPGSAIREVVRSATHSYQGRMRNTGPEQTEKFSRSVRIGRDGRVSIENISGDITVSAGSGDEVSIDAVKHTRGDQSDLARVQIVVDERPGRVDVRTDYDTDRTRRNRSNDTSVDYTVVVPAGVSITVKSISGSVKVTGVRGAVRAETISGNLTTASTPKLEFAKTVSGEMDIADVSSDADVTMSSVSGNLHARGLKAHALDLGTVSGDLILNNVTCDRLGAKSVSGNVEYGGSLARSGRYDINSHSGTVRLALAGTTGFELNATSFSGSVRSELPLTIGGGDANARDGRRSYGPRTTNMHATFGDGSAALIIRTFSGDIVITKR